MELNIRIAKIQNSVLETDGLTKGAIVDKVVRHALKNIDILMEDDQFTDVAIAFSETGGKLQIYGLPIYQVHSSLWGDMLEKTAETLDIYGCILLYPSNLSLGEVVIAAYISSTDGGGNVYFRSIEDNKVVGDIIGPLPLTDFSLLGHNTKPKEGEIWN